ncbi:MAG: aldehyde dehydrogenase [Candidatus Omnitrophota bacterium]|nr:aldehyde dehydrogenase [Candidatus Omnitrophota bacterium]
MLAKMAVEETGMGRVEDKIAKNALVIEKTFGIEGREYKPSDAYFGDYGVTFLNGVPFGVIGAVTPSTNPGATIINNSITMLSSGNVVIFNTHPGAKNISNMAVMLVNKAIREAGCQAGLVFSIKNPTIESSQQLMKHPDVRLLVVTGGPDVVKTAMSSGKKVIAAGPGNPPVIVDETAEIAEAAGYIVIGASFDNNVLCIAEKEVFVVSEIADALKKEMSKHNAHELSSSDLEKITKMVFIERDGAKAVNKKYIGKDAGLIARDAGVSVPAGTRLLFGETKFDHPLVQHEQLMPVLPIVRVKDWEEAMDLAIRAEHGYLHTSIMHSTNIERLMVVAKKVNTTLFVENGHSLSSLGYEAEGYTSMTIAGPTGEGVTGPWSFIRQRRFVMRDSFRGSIGSLPHS